MGRWISILLVAAVAAVPIGAQPPAGSLDTILTAAASLPRLRSVVASHRGEVVVERYYHGARSGGLANVKSVSKSVIAALVGIAINRGAIDSVDQPVGAYFPELAKDPDTRKASITLEDLLTMRSGLESTSGRNYGAWVTSGNWVRYVLNRPMITEPGTRVEYSTGNSHLLSAILTKATGMNTWRYAQDQLAKPLGFSLARWPQDPQGIYFGGNEMLMTPRQMIRFGELYLHDGRAGQQQLLPKDWVARTVIPRGRSRWGNDREYGLGWWIRELGGRRTYYAWGYGGQFIFVVPDAQLVVVTTSRSDVSRDRRDHNDAIYDLVDALVRQIA